MQDLQRESAEAIKRHKEKLTELEEEVRRFKEDCRESKRRREDSNG